MTLPPQIVRRVPMSSAQRRLFLQCQLPGGDRAYHLVVLARVRGPFPMAAVQAFVERTMERHEALRCAFRVVDGEFVCEVHRQVEVRLALREEDGFDPETDLDALVEACDLPFQLAVPPLLRVVIQPCGPDDLILAFVCHHLIFDGFSGGVVAKEAEAALAGTPLPPPARGYADFAAWETGFFASPDYVRQRDFWLGRYPAPPERLALPMDRPRPARKDFAGASLIRYLDTRDVRALAKGCGATMFMTLLAAFFCTLHKVTGGRDITLGTLVSPREAGGFGNVVGLFANTLPLTARVAPEDRFVDFLGQVRSLVLDALRNAEFPFEHLVEGLPFAEPNQWNPLFDVVFNFERTMPRRAAATGGTRVETLDRYARVSMFDLSIDLVEYEDEVRLRVEYATALFREETVRGLLDGFCAVVRQVCERPDLPVGEISLLSEEARASLAAWNDTARQIETGTFLDTWRKQAARQADFPALRLGAAELSYDRVETRANRLARALIARGVVPGAVVAVALDGGIDWPVVLLAIWKAGAVYLPMSPDAPPRRTAHQLHDTAAVLLVTRAAHRQAFADVAVAATIEDIEAEARGLAADDPGPGASPDDAAYIIYTSGSSGTPKGVVVGHRAVHGHIDAVRGVYRARPDDNLLQFAAPVFDASLEQVLVAWAAGACSVLVASRHVAPRALLDEMAAGEVTMAEFPPALLRELVPLLTPGRTRRLRRLISGGDVLDPRTAAEVTGSLPPEARLINIYGPTEATMAASAFNVPAEVSPWAGRPSLPIGRPLPNTRFYILAPDGGLLPPGVPGELCIAGDRLAQGYQGRPDLTAEKFTNLGPPGAAERVYRTGDRARWLDDGNVEFLGRLDRQVKLRGHRIELGEIERTLQAHPEVAEAVVVKRGEGAARLIGFVVPRRPGGTDEAALAAWLRERLPEPMVPSALSLVEALPRNAAGKVDLAALPETADGGAAVETDAPIDALEWAVWEIWREALGFSGFGRSDTLSRLGGNSLTAVRIMVEVRNRFGIDPPLALMLRAPTVAAVADFLRAADAPEPASAVVRLGGAADARTVVLLPGQGGWLLDLHELSAALRDDFRVLGAQYPDDLWKVEDLAARLERDLGAAAGVRGGLLVGHSFGGHVAVELAGRLEAAGNGPRSVILLDAAPPEAERRRPAPTREDLLDLAVWMLLGRRDESVWPATSAGVASGDPFERAVALLKAAGRVPETMDAEAFARGIDVVAARAGGLRRKGSPIRADIHLLKAADGPAADDWDWSSATSGRFCRHTVDGNHFDMMKGRNAWRVRDVIRTIVSATGETRAG